LHWAGIRVPLAHYDEPEHLGVGVVEHLAQLVWPNQRTAVLRHSERLVAYADSPRSFQNEILLPGYACGACRRYSLVTAKVSLQDFRSWFAQENPRLGFSLCWRDASGGPSGVIKK
jgi:hypothetical protein